MAPAILMAEFCLTVILTYDTEGATIRAGILSILNKFQLLKALLPLLAAVQTSNRADITRKITSLNPYHLTMN